jgi:hypothetical protein
VATIDVTTTEIACLDGVTMPIQTQLNNIVSSQWTGSSNIYYDGGNVGIGTSNPTEKLDITGNVSAGYFKGDGSLLTNIVTKVAGRSGDVILSRDDVGLDRVDNTTDQEKPVSIPVQNALNNLQPVITGAASSIAVQNLTNNRALVSDGFGKVGVSVTSSTELGYLKGVTSFIQQQLDNKISSQWTTDNSNIYFNGGNVGIGTLNPDERLVVDGNVKAAFFLGDGSMLSNLPQPPVSSVAGRTGAVVLSKEDVGLTNVDNTSDMNKPVSNPVQLALDNLQPLITGAATTILNTNLLPNLALISNTSGKVDESQVTTVELNYLSGVSSPIQYQLDNKISSQWTSSNNDIYYVGGNIGIGTTVSGSKLSVVGLPFYSDDAAAGAGGLNTGDFYQTDGTGAAPLNVVGILMVKQ